MDDALFFVSTHANAATIRDDGRHSNDPSGFCPSLADSDSLPCVQTPHASNSLHTYEGER
jgi:hypothetical protein